jgi:hypothetical protein
MEAAWAPAPGRGGHGGGAATGQGGHAAILPAGTPDPEHELGRSGCGTG